MVGKIVKNGNIIIFWKDNSRRFRYLCLEHIKIFNKNWNYFSDMSESDRIFIKSDLTWHKPTKSFASSDNFFKVLWNNALEDKTNIFDKINNKTLEIQNYPRKIVTHYKF